MIDMEKTRYRGPAPMIDMEKTRYRGPAPMIDMEKTRYRGPAPMINLEKTRYRGPAPMIDMEKTRYRGPAPMINLEKTRYRGSVPAPRARGAPALSSRERLTLPSCVKAGCKHRSQIDPDPLDLLGWRGLRITRCRVHPRQQRGMSHGALQLLMERLGRQPLRWTTGRGFSPAGGSKFRKPGGTTIALAGCRGPHGDRFATSSWNGFEDR
jgi:hypothetical protein